MPFDFAQDKPALRNGRRRPAEASADFPLPDALLFVDCNPGNSARVAIEDAALKGRLYARRKKKKPPAGSPYRTSQRYKKSRSVDA